MIEVINDLMAYDGIKIIQRPDMFNFSLDSLLLAYFAPINKKTKKIMDFCTGNGPIPLYLSLRTEANIDAVEIQKDVFDLLVKNVSINKLEKQIKCYNQSVIGINKVVRANTYDLITCNPPYFKVTSNESHLNKSEYKTIARHEVSITIEDVIVEAKKLLKSKGYFVLVHKPDRLVEIISLLKTHKLEPKEAYFIHPKKGKDANHMILICQKDGLTELKVHDAIVVYDESGNYTEPIKAIFNYKTMLK